MKGQTGVQAADWKKTVAVGALFAASAAITILGLAMCAYSLIHQVTFKAMQTEIPGAVFGVVVAFLGVRYFLAVRKLKTEVYKSTSRFSWSNFRKKS